MDFTSLVKQQRDFFLTDVTRSVQFRIETLRRLVAAIQARESEILAALHEDLRKPAQEAYASDIGFVLSEIEYAATHLRKWAKPQRRRAPWMAWPSSAQVEPQPRGVALIVGPWNYPVQLLLTPLVGALAAGNCAILKTSEWAPHSAKVIADIAHDAFEEKHVAVLHGDRAVSQALLCERFDAIFFTGSTSVGKDVMRAAAMHLTPVTLELGGKSPCIVCRDAPLDIAARRIIWGKMMNAGQTCVAPDYVLVDSSRHDDLIAAMKTAIEAFYSSNPQQSPHFGRIVNRRHFDRLVNYLNDGKVASGGEHNVDDLYIAPTLLTEVSTDAPVMTEEIFGPILPIVPVKDIAEAFDFVRSRPAPLSLYLFTKDRDIQRRVTSELSSGGVCINDTVVQLCGKDLPFGGVGESGIGSYHGKASFDTFTHFKTVLRCSTAFDFPLRYPPPRMAISRFKKVLRFLLKR